MKHHNFWGNEQITPKHRKNSGLCHFNHLSCKNQAGVLSRLMMDLQSHAVLTLNIDKAQQRQRFGILGKFL